MPHSLWGNLSILSATLLWVLGSDATTCPTCNPSPGQNLCHSTTSCIVIDGSLSSSTNPVQYCACSHGFRAESGILAGDTSNQFRLPWASQEGRVFVKPGVVCNQLCDAWTLGRDGCKEVQELSQCLDGRGDTVPGGEDSSNCPKANKDAITEYLENRRAGMDIVQTTRTPNGQVIDWIREASQGPLADFPGPNLAPPPKNGFPEGIPLSDLELDGAELGPSGTVPIIRPNITLLKNSTTLNEFMIKGDFRRRPSNYTVPGKFKYKRSSGKTPHLYSSSSQSVSNYGGQGQFNLVNPTTLNDDFSLLQVAVARDNGNFYPEAPQADRYTQTVEAGLMVYPGYLGDHLTHLFAYYTTNGYASHGDNVGGYSNLVKGWVQRSKRIAPGIIFSPPSVKAGQQYYVWIVYQLYQGNWWLWVKDDWIGYFPAHMFGDGRPERNRTLEDHADSIAFYGEVIVGEDGGTSTITDMGSGSLPTTGWQNSAYIHNILYQSQPGEENSNQYYDGSFGIQTDTTEGYYMEQHFENRDSWGSFMWLGGPGSDGIRNDE
ncbi:hypothetical protein BP6252_13967 [Coleophoma cylindrospora]|uniref:Neprosin PEP catalytic domain-containing protein n=1 Tax=Coleophoma cylindrospora TaxID=1849047 RepID=A0A3D8Q4P1_9HELO|nr:hypothetical protein BP6252_13967 [Coleophoma cylindrospora]